MDTKILEKLELNKILQIVSSFACLEQTKQALLKLNPACDVVSVKNKLALTDECDKLLYRYGISKIAYFPVFYDELAYAKRGATLSCGELLSVQRLLASTRCCYNSISSIEDETLCLVKERIKNLYFDKQLEQDIESKIISDSQISDYASDELYSIRKAIRELNERIRSTLSTYLKGDTADFLQDAIITMRGDRYVIPVRSEYKTRVKGFIHDRSTSGATVFIEPEQILDMNNELKSLQFDEQQEIERILAELTKRVGCFADQLERDIEILSELDSYFARAEYSYKNKCSLPKVNQKGVIKIVKGRHPLIDAKKVVPVSVEFGDEFSFLLISGPNTGGKTVTLKMCGLFCLMAMCGIFIPAGEGSEVSVFNNIFVDVGDEQSIEESLSLFSSHISNIIEITKNADRNSLVLIDELGGGTDPEEGQALAKAIIKRLLFLGAKGVITTHYTALKEFAYSEKGITNACMEFDKQTLQPLFRIKIGLSGSSNAIAVSRRLGLSEEIINEALANMSEGAQAYENIVRRAEESRVKAEQELTETMRLKNEWTQNLSIVESEKEKLRKEREKLLANAKVESKRIVNERCSLAEEYIAEIDEILKKAQENEVSEADLIKARMLKNKLGDLAFDLEAESVTKTSVTQTAVEFNNLKIGDYVFVPKMSKDGEILSLNERKKEVEVLCGDIKLTVKAKDLLTPLEGKCQHSKPTVQVNRKIEMGRLPQREINLLGLTVSEALPEVDAFIDRAVVDCLDEIKIVHGTGTGKLKQAIAEHLRKHKSVEEYRLGKYGEGEAGVTIVKLK